MTQHYLKHLFSPRSVVVFGASADTCSIGGVVYSNLLAGGYAGALHPINIRPQTIAGQAVFGSLDEVPGGVDLAVIATPAESVPPIVEACGKRGVKAIALLSAGFSEAGARGAFIERQIIASARRHGLRILGAKGLGVVRPASGLHASVGAGRPRAGDLALVSQSAAVCASVLDWAHNNDIGFSTIVSLGTAMDIDFGDVLDFLVSDPATRGILLHVERVRDARRFMSALRAAARVKPVVAVRAGRFSNAPAEQSGGKISHDAVFDAALARAGAVRVRSIGDLFSSARVLAGAKRPAGGRLAIVCNGHGPGLLAADRAGELSLTLAELGSATIRGLDKAQHPGWSRCNPLDIIGDAGHERFVQALEACVSDAGVDGVLAILCPQTITDPLRLAGSLIEIDARCAKPILACWMGEVQVREARHLFNDARLPSFRAPEAAVEAFAALARHHQNRLNLMQTPAAMSRQDSPDIEGARLIIDTALTERRQELSELEARAVASAFRMPVNTHFLARSPNEALLFAEQIGFPVALKVLASNVVSRRQCGGIMLNLANAQAVRTAFHDIHAAVAKRCPEAVIEGVAVERMALRPGARELAIGVFHDAVFGPAISLGLGGVHGRIRHRRAVALPPLNRSLIDRFLDDPRIAAYIAADEGEAEVNREALAALLERVSEMVCELPWIRSLELNPCLADAEGVLVLAARMGLSPHFAGAERYRHMAISPYPVHLVREGQLADGTELLIRPIRPEDADAEQEFVRGLSDQSRYLRFQLSLNELTPATLARFTQIDYDREMALVAEAGHGAERALIGEARYTINPDGESCEFGLVVADAWRHLGLGTKLMHCLGDAAHARGLKNIRGDVLAENTGMRRLMASLGYVEEAGEDEEMVVVVKTL